MAEGPLLVTEVSLTPHEGKEVTLTFKLARSRRIDMKMPATALWGLVHLLQQLAERAALGADLQMLQMPSGSAADAGKRLEALLG